MAPTACTPGRAWSLANRSRKRGGRCLCGPDGRGPRRPGATNGGRHGPGPAERPRVADSAGNDGRGEGQGRPDSEPRSGGGSGAGARRDGEGPRSAHAVLRSPAPLGRRRAGGGRSAHDARHGRELPRKQRVRARVSHAAPVEHPRMGRDGVGIGSFVVSFPLQPPLRPLLHPAAASSMGIGPGGVVWKETF